MNKFGFTTLGAAVAAGLTAALIGLAAPAVAAPTENANAQQTIARLQSEGYTVIVTQLGTAPLDEAEVVAIRPGQTFQRIDAGSPILGSSKNFTTVQDKTVYVDVR